MRRKAFTLIELLIVVAIIAILAMIAVPNFLEAQTRAKVTRVRTDFRNILVAMEAYRTDNNNYPPDGNIGTSWFNDIKPLCMLTTPIAYITSVPTNPFFDIRRSQATDGTTGVGNYAFWGADRHPNLLPICFHLVSCGPNLEDDGLGGLNGPDVIGRVPNFVRRIYDPTNGVVSYGDLLCTDRGIVF